MVYLNIPYHAWMVSHYAWHPMPCDGGIIPFVSFARAQKFIAKSNGATKLYWSYLIYQNDNSSLLFDKLNGNLFSFELLQEWIFRQFRLAAP